uniref:RNA-directed RNA polymerase n=1 Tax=Leviviridae sp. TaxID=2027243 RepID=A0A514D2F7_9VIRU|nr:MAG: RNA-dependent RNA polymerase [Leviviridae sp.]
MYKLVFVKTAEGRSSFTIDDDFCTACGVDHDNIEGCMLFVASWLALLSDSPLNSGSSAKPKRTYAAFMQRLVRDGLRKTVIEFSALSHKLVSQHMLMGQPTLIGDWIDDFKDTPLFFEYNRYYKSGDIDVLRFIYTFLNFGKKLDYDDEEFHKTAFRGWIDIEEKLARLSFDSTDIGCISAILESCLPRFKITNFFPKFGPGSVQERGVRGRIDKVDTFSYDPMIDRFLLHGFIGNYGLGEEQGLTSDRCVPNAPRWKPGGRVSSRVSRLRFARKDLRTARSIGMEPNVLQYFQQGVNRSMMELIDNSSFSSFIKLQHQEDNKRLAEYGSYTGLVDTIDLSSASDCLSLTLAKAVFPRSWLIPMLVTRSNECILPNGDLHRLQKFAPMGSALCFPTQCVLFTGVCLYAACQFSYDSLPSTLTLLEFVKANCVAISKSFGSANGYTADRHSFQECRVYGDDICIDYRLTQIVMSILDRLGFVVNRNKSFVGSQAFRESCGGFYLNGSDITPLYYRVKGVHQSKLTGEQLASEVALINSCWDRGYKYVYRFHVRQVLGWSTNVRSSRSSMNSVLFVLPGSDTFGIFSKNPRNSHLERREQPDVPGKPWYQRTEMRCISLTYEYRIREPHKFMLDPYEYMRWMGNHSTDKICEDTFSHQSSDTGGARVVWRWTPATD